MKNEKFVDVNGYRTRYWEAGEGKPVVFVHCCDIGSYASLALWDLNLRSFAKRFHVYAFDRLGMGLTDIPTSKEGFFMESTIDHAIGFLTTMGLDSVWIVGSSRGAYIAVRLAIMHPQLVSGLILTNSGTLALDDLSYPKNFYWNLEDSLPEIPTEESVTRLFRALSYSPSHLTKGLVDDLLRVAKLDKTTRAKRIMKEIRDEFEQDLRKKRAETISMIRKGRLRLPTLIVFGINDPTVPIKLTVDLMSLLIQSGAPTVQLHVYDRAGHLPYRERAKEFNEECILFIENNL